MPVVVGISRCHRIGLHFYPQHAGRNLIIKLIAGVSAREIIKMISVSIVAIRAAGFFGQVEAVGGKRCAMQ